MHKLRNVLITISLSLGASAVAFSQGDVASVLKNKFNSYQSKLFMEKVYAHVDKASYFTGETIWFKAYIVDGGSNRPASISKVVYAELLNDKNEAVVQGMIKVDGSSGSGSFYLPFTVSSGNYRFRAYTNWMKNFNADFFFEKNILVINPLLAAPADMAREGARKYEVNFFPESGVLVNNVTSRIGVKVCDPNGKGIDYSGYLLNQRNDTVAAFQSLKFGLGTFAFMPKSGESYRSIILPVGDSSINASVPVPKEDGYVLSVVDEGERLKVSILSSQNYVGQALYVLVHCRQQVKLAQMQISRVGGSIMYIDKSSLGEGINTITLFNEQQQPLCERLWFRPPQQRMAIDASVNATVLAPRSAGMIELNTRDGVARPLRSDISVSVHLVDSLSNGDDQADILSYLWLKGDLRGEIESPGYYFSGETEAIKAATDNLMLTLGWRRFTWDDVLHNNNGPAFSFLPEYEGHTVTGTITDRKTGLPAQNILLYVSSVAARNSFGLTRSNKNGLFAAILKQPYGRGDMIVQADPRGTGSYQLNVASPFSVNFSDTHLSATQISERSAMQVLDGGVDAQVQNVYFADQLRRMTLPALADSNAFYGKADSKYFLDKYTRFTTMEEIIREYVAGVSIRKRGGRFHLSINDQPHAQYFASDPMVLVDEVPVFDMDKLMAFSPLKVNKVEVMNRRYVYNDIVMPGILSYSTYKGDLEGFKLDPSALVVSYEGLQLKREFYAPEYRTSEQVHSRLPDFRTQLTWQPSIAQDVVGHAIVSFTTSDIEGRYVVFIEGISNDGKAGSKAIYFEVRK